MVNLWCFLAAYKNILFSCQKYSNSVTAYKESSRQVRFVLAQTSTSSVYSLISTNYLWQTVLWFLSISCLIPKTTEKVGANKFQMLHKFLICLGSLSCSHVGRCVQSVLSLVMWKEMSNIQMLRDSSLFSSVPWLGVVIR